MGGRSPPSSDGAVELHVRCAERRGDGRAQTGDVKGGLALLADARALVERDDFSDIDRAEVLYRLGVCRYMLSSISTAVGLFNEALTLAQRSGLPSDALRLNVFAWRSRCYRRQRDYEAAREDVERALELAEAMHDARALGQAYFQASVLAERDGHWVLARTYAEKAKAQYEELSDRAKRRPALEQPRWPRVPARQARAGDRAPQAFVRGRARGRA